MTTQPPQPPQPPQAPPPPRPPQPPPPPPYYRPPGPIAAAPPRSSPWRWGCGFALAGCLLLIVLGGFLLLLMAISAGGGMGGLSTMGDKIALVRIDGMIIAGRSGFSMFGGAASGSDDIVAQIERAVNDKSVKGILLRINSPGGSAAGSQEIYQAVKDARDARNGEFVVVVSMADVAASGGYYVAAPADKIFADPATITGSIGALAMHEDMSGLFQKIGIKPEVIKSGELKDMFNPFTPMSDEARAIIEDLVSEVHHQFVNHVAEGRGMDPAAVHALADGRIYTGQQAVGNGLVDEIGGFEQALDAAGELAGIGPDPATKEYVEPSLMRMLFGTSSSLARPASAKPGIAVTGGLLYDSLAAQLAGHAVPALGVLRPDSAAAPQTAAHQPPTPDHR